MSLKHQFESTEAFKKYQDEICERYRRSPDVMNAMQIVREENAKGYTVHYTQFKRWLKARGIRKRRIRWNKAKVQKSPLGFFLSNDIIDNIKLFNKSKHGISRNDIVELGISLVLGIPTRNVVLYLDDKRTVLFISQNPLDFSAYTHEKVSPAELGIIKDMVNGARTHGVNYIISRSEQIGLKYIGGTLNTIEDNETNTEEWGK